MNLLILLLIALVPLLGWMSSTSAVSPGVRSGARSVLLLVLGMCVAGFGLCGAAGTFLGVAALFQGGLDDKFAFLALAPGAIGLVLAFGAYKLHAKFRRQSPRPKSGQ